MSFALTRRFLWSCQLATNVVVAKERTMHVSENEAILPVIWCFRRSLNTKAARNLTSAGNRRAGKIRGHARNSKNTRVRAKNLACARGFCPFLCLLPKRDHLQSNTYSVHYGIFVTKCHTFQQHQHVTFDLSLKQTPYHKLLLEFSTTIEKFLRSC